MGNLSKGEQKSLSNFFNNLAVAWVAAGIIAPAYILTLPNNIRMIYLWSGAFAGWFCLKVALNLSKND